MKTSQLELGSERLKGAIFYPADFEIIRLDSSGVDKHHDSRLLILDSATSSHILVHNNTFTKLTLVKNVCPHTAWQSSFPDSKIYDYPKKNVLKHMQATIKNLDKYQELCQQGEELLLPKTDPDQFESLQLLLPKEYRKAQDNLHHIAMKSATLHNNEMENLVKSVFNNDYHDQYYYKNFVEDMATLTGTHATEEETDGFSTTDILTKIENNIPFTAAETARLGELVATSDKLTALINAEEKRQNDIKAQQQHNLPHAERQNLGYSYLFADDESEPTKQETTISQKLLRNFNFFNKAKTHELSDKFDGF